MKNTKDACNSDGAFHAEFAAHCTAMNLYGFFTDLQFVSDLLIEQSPRHFLSNHLFPSRKRVKNVSVFICQDSAGDARRPYSPLFQWLLKGDRR